MDTDPWYSAIIILTLLQLNGWLQLMKLIRGQIWEHFTVQYSVGFILCTGELQAYEIIGVIYFPCRDFVVVHPPHHSAELGRLVELQGGMTLCFGCMIYRASMRSCCQGWSNFSLCIFKWWKLEFLRCSNQLLIVQGRTVLHIKKHLCVYGIFFRPLFAFMAYFFVITQCISFSKVSSNCSFL